MSPSPRVVHITTVHQVTDPRILYKETASLARAGYNVFLIAPHISKERIQNVQILPLNGNGGRLRRVRDAYKIALDLSADVYHFHDPEFIPAAYALKKATDAKIIYDIHEDNADKGMLLGRSIRAMENWCFSWIDHVVLAETSYTSFVPGTVPKTVLLNYFLPAKTSRIDISHRTFKPFRLIYAGVQGTIRGLPQLIRLAEDIRQNQLDWMVHLSGICYRDKDRKQAEKAILKADLSNTLVRSGWQNFRSHQEVMNDCSKAHIGLCLLHPVQNYTKTIPTKFYEYMYFGLPIICSDFPLWQHFIETHNCGLVVNPFDPVQVLENISNLYSDRERYFRLARNGQQASRNFTWIKMENKLTRLYRTILDRD